MGDTIIKIREMAIGHTYDTFMLLQAITEKTAKNGKSYVELTLCDGEKSIMARMFDCSSNDLAIDDIIPESIIKVALKVDTYKEVVNYTVQKISNTFYTDLTINDFVVTAPIDVDITYERLINTIKYSHKSCADDGKFDPISELTAQLIEINKAEFIHSSAAKTIHHNVIGGLLYHTATMVDQAHLTCSNYPELDRELLICGAALHDIGKIAEMSTSPTGHTEYTRDGRLLGHALIGIMMIDSISDYYNCNPERLRLLEHMVAAHHGKLEYGAISIPAIPEAAVLHAIDMIDSRAYIFCEEYKDMEPAELSGNLYALGSSTIYKPESIVPISEPECNDDEMLWDYSPKEEVDEDDIW